MSISPNAAADPVRRKTQDPGRKVGQRGPDRGDELRAPEQREVALAEDIVYKASPKEVKMLMIDPKLLELSIYEDIPHLVSPVITNPKQAAEALRKMVFEMERKYRLLAEKGSRNIDSYNRNSPDEEQIPYIVVFIDELADLMFASSREVEDSITRLAQMARAAGIHLIIATQRPSVDVITGIIKANFPARISFQVFSKIDSRTILDSQGVEKLLGKGDMLMMLPGAAGAARGALRRACLRHVRPLGPVLADRSRRVGQEHAVVPTAEYMRLMQTFTAREFNGRDLARIARSAGMRYVTHTSRHHDGFSLYDTQGLSPYDVTHTPAGRDLIADFVGGCRAEGIVPMLYCTTLDWSDERFANDWKAYQQYLRASVEILCTRYGDIGGFWFDGNWSKPEADWELDALYGLIRRHQPEALIINNTGNGSLGGGGLAACSATNCLVISNTAASYGGGAAPGRCATGRGWRGPG